jgi:hypothetical protein
VRCGELPELPVDTGRMTMRFYDKAGREMLVEQIS